MTTPRIAVIGAGRMGSLYAQIIQQYPLANLAGLVCGRSERVKNLQVAFNVPVFFGAELARLWAEVPNLDGVIVATPEWEHMNPVVEAAKRGLPVLLEKPMTNNLQDSLELAKIIRQESSTFMLCHVVRFDPRYASMRNVVAGGAIGRVRQMHARRNADQQAAARILGRCHPAFWLTPHDVDIMRWITGQEVRRVAARYAGTGTGRADGLFVDLVFSDGAVGRVENSWVTPPLASARNCIFDVLGENGAVEISAYEQGLIVRIPDDRIKVPNTFEICNVNGRITGAFANMVHHFVDTVAERAAPAIGLRDGLATMLVADAISRSLETGSEVYVED